MFFFPDQERIQHYSVESSRTTHGAPECLDACRLFGDMLFRALGGADKRIFFWARIQIGSVRQLKSIALGEYMNKAAIGIRGTGYVVASLEAAL